jgi:hypothetical protein
MTSDTVFNHETVALDGEEFSDCEFRSCRLVYSGGPLPKFSNCRFDEIEWKLDDAAQRTLAYMKLMWGVGAKAPVQALIKDVTAVK